MTIRAFAALESHGKLTPYTYPSRELRSHELKVKISHCGICHSDVHLIDNDWGFSQYPLVAGHEVIGTVESLGSSVTHLRVGQRVGIGWASGACLECEYCIRGDDNLCSQAQATAVGREGGFGEAIVLDSRWAFPIPEALSSENAAPLLCGGITVYAPLRVYGVTPNMKIGVIGIGGLGHLALQFARAWGCEVTAFSSSSDKEAEARSFGAHHFVSSSDPEAMKSRASSLDMILSTVNVDLDWNAYLNILRPDGKLCFVGVPQSQIQIAAFPLIAGRRSICGNPTGSRSQIQDMLQFAARHGIQAKTEVMPMSEINQALDRVRANKARYRMVLKV
ncbi:MAG: NAD(P)-dependent alcohol dehydrogenase [Proteobacteria bacterium]|nr:NAD(P)-dependent alcohol dehydrogenase [Pseudomonadota bacterium]